jgi:hypothetical protein
MSKFLSASIVIVVKTSPSQYDRAKGDWCPELEDALHKRKNLGHGKPGTSLKIGVLMDRLWLAVAGDAEEKQQKQIVGEGEEQEKGINEA